MGLREDEAQRVEEKIYKEGEVLFAGLKNNYYLKK